MEREILEKLQDLERKVDATFATVEKIRKYFLWTFVVTIVTVVLPIVALAFIVPWVFNILSTTYVNIQ